MALTNRLYKSGTTSSVGLDDLLAIQHESISNNSRLNTTSILLHIEGQFVHLLEGEHDVILELFIKIVQDDRHQNVRLLYHDPVDQRAFADWHMAMLDLELHGDAEKLDAKDLIFYAERLNTDPTAKQQISDILGRFRDLLLADCDEE